MPQEIDLPDLPEPPELPEIPTPDLPDLPEPPELPEPPQIKEKTVTIPTPFGKTYLQSPTLPSLRPPTLDNRRREAFKHVVASDIGSVIGAIPVVGDIVADVVEDLHAAELRKLLSSQEAQEYAKQDKVAPSTIALIRAFQRSKK